MTGVAWPINASAGAPSYPARAARNTAAAMKMWDGNAVAGRQGVRAMGGSAANVVTLSGSTITINLHAAEVTPAGWSTVTGTYDVALTVIETKTLTPADPTNPRKDLVIGRVYDHDEAASSLRQYTTEYIAGIAGPSPSEPAVPAGGIKLATIDVPFLGNGSPVVTNNYTYTVAAGGILPVRSQAERDAIVTPHDGQTVYRKDKGFLEFYDTNSSTWRAHRSVVAVPLQTDISHPAAAQVIFLTTGIKGFYYYAGTWIPVTIAHQQQATAFVNTTSNSYVALTGDPAITFTAPMSGQIHVAISAAIACGDAATTGRAAFEIWTGPTPGGGIGVYSANEIDAIAWQGTANWEAGRPPSLVGGLIPGSTYSARMIYRRDTGTSTAGYARRRMNITAA